MKIWTRNETVRLGRSGASVRNAGPRMRGNLDLGLPGGSAATSVLWASVGSGATQSAVGFQPGAKRPEDCVLPAGARRPEAVAFPPGTERSRTVCFPAGAKRPRAVGSEVSPMRCSVLRAADGSEATWGLKRLVMFFYRSFLIEILIISSLRYQRTTFSISNERYKP